MDPKPDEQIDPVTGEVTPIEETKRYRLRNLYIDSLGREVPDPRPMAPPVGYKKQPSIFELVREATAREVALYAANREPESFEEADDFDVDDDYDPHSPWENDFDPPWSEVRQAIMEERAKNAAVDKKPPEKPLSPPPPSPPSGKRDRDPDETA